MRLSLLAVLVVAATVAAADPPIRFPAGPSPAPQAVSKLTADRLYVVDSDVELIIKTIPEGVVSKKSASGPKTFVAKFADGGDDYEEREYKGKFLYTFRAVGTGEVTLVVIPAGIKAESEVIMKAIQVEAGKGPQPPPGPTPPPKTDRLFWVVVTEETSARTADTAALLNDLKYWKGLETVGHKWRMYDKDVGDGVGYAARAKEAGVELPAVLLYDQSAKDGEKPAAAERLPKDKDGMDALIKKYGGKR
jgi:hypothetical protein